jgi:hypothetical protein
MRTDFTHIRPRFEFTIPIPKDELILRFRRLFDGAPSPFSGKIMENHIVLDIVGPEAHYWSPHFSFRIEENEEDNTKSNIYGLIGPKPAVWTMFMFIYVGIGVVGFFMTSYAWAEATVGTPSWMIWSLPVSIVLMLTAYGTSKFGQSLGKEQIEQMKEFLNQAIR